MVSSIGIPVPVKVDVEKCSGCEICYSTYPFDAISLGDGKKLNIEFEKCQLCGMWSTSCPSSAIEMAYYNYDLVVEDFKRKKKDTKAENLVFDMSRLCFLELLYAAERAVELATDPEIINTDIRNILKEAPERGVGIVEAVRGKLIYDYRLTEDALIDKVNLIVATTNNKGVIYMSISNAAKELIKNNKVDQGLLNKVEMFFRAYHPCFACATHALPGKILLETIIYDSTGSNYQELNNYGFRVGRNGNM